MSDLVKQREALINNITGSIDAMIRDAIALHFAQLNTKDQEVLQDLKDRVHQARGLLRGSLEQLLL